MSRWRHGNALEDGASHGGWMLGHFIPPDESLRSTGDVEVKWARHDAGDGRSAWATNDVATTLSILVRGRFRIIFEGAEALLEREGDYALWGPGVPHTWRAEEESVIVTVRWPSLAGDSRGESAR